jgi:hypothetical protein
MRGCAKYTLLSIAANDRSTLRHIQILEHLRAPDQAKPTRISRHRKFSLPAKPQERKKKLARIVAKQDQLNNDINHYLRSHVEHVSPILFKQVDENLPRELCDEVYGFIVGQKTISISSKEPFRVPSTEYAIPGHTTASRSNHFQTTLVSLGYSHILKAGCVDTGIIVRLAEVWYKNSTFRFIDPLHINIFLRTDFQGFNLDPQCLIRRIELSTVITWTGTCVQLSQNLAELHNLRRRTNIQLSFQAVNGLCDPLADPSATIPILDLTLLFPSIQELIAAHYHVTVKLGFYLKFKVVSEDLTEECWREKVESYFKVNFIVW